MEQTIRIIGESEPFGKLTVDKEILIYALRYILNRLGFSPYKVIENIKLNIDKFSMRDLSHIVAEIVESGCLETEYDYQQWYGFVDDLMSEIKRREINEI